MKREQETFPYIAQLLNGAEVEWKPLGEVCEFSNTGVDKKTIEGEKKVKLLNFVDVFHKQYITKETPTMIVSASDKKILDCNILKGDVFITPSSEILDEIGYSATAIEDIEGAVYSYHIMRLRIYDKEVLHPEYLAYLFSSDTVRKQIRIKAQGITRFGLTLPRWKSIQIPLPPLSVQQEIVRILDKFNQLEAELDCRKRQYEYYRNKLLSYEGNEVEWKTLGEVGTFIRGNGLQKKDLTTNGVPAIHYGQIYTYYGVSAEQTISFVSPETAKGLRKVDYGDVIITNTSENIDDVGKAVAYCVKEQGVTGGHATIFKPSEKIIGKYLVYYTQTTEFSNQKRKYAKGTKVIDISANDLAKITIPLPPLSEQQRIATILDKFDTLVNSISEGLPKEIALRRKQYEYYREKLLSFPKQ